MPVESSKPPPDLEEDDQDPIQHVQEIPEQTWEAARPLPAVTKPFDLEHTNLRVHTGPSVQVGPPQSVVGPSVFSVENGSYPTDTLMMGPANPEPKPVAVPAFPPPVAQGSGPAIVTARVAPRNLQFDSGDGAVADGSIRVTSGGLQINIEPGYARNFLDSNRVQIGTSQLGRRLGSQGGVARYRVRFIRPFQHRPVVVIQTVPEGTQQGNDVEPHSDVFVASVAEVRLDYFVVDVLRVDAMGSGWGQDLYLDWIAMEYESDYPKATKGPGDFEKLSVEPTGAM